MKAFRYILAQDGKIIMEGSYKEVLKSFKQGMSMYRDYFGRLVRIK